LQALRVTSQCMRPLATSVCGLELLVYAALSCLASKRSELQALRVTVRATQQPQGLLRSPKAYLRYRSMPDGLLCSQELQALRVTARAAQQWYA
jgi:hypothetical protein